MRAFEFHAGEFDEDVESMIIDLDSVVALAQKLFSATGKRRWIVTLSSGTSVFVTKPAFDRLLLAWRSK